MVTHGSSARVSAAAPFVSSFGPSRSGCTDETYCPDGGGQEPIGGRKSGDKWSPISDSPNKWVQVGAWAGSNANTCLGHDEIANGVHGDP